MWAEELNLWALDEQNNWQEVSEKDKQKVSEDSKKAKQVRKKIKDSQVKWKEIALFLSKILWRYYDNWVIVNIIYTFLKYIEDEYENLLKIFTPFLTSDDSFSYTKINKYIEYIKKNMDILTDEHINLIVSLIECEKLWWDSFWSTLKKKDSDINYENFIKELKLELKS